MSDRRKDTSTELSEVRTVLSRAETALDVLERYAEREFVWWDNKTPLVHDPEDREIIEALQQVVRILDRFRSGRSRRRR